MSHSWVPNIELNQDGTISLYLTVEGFDEGTLIELSGQATQTNGAVASFYSVQAVPALTEKRAAMEVKAVRAVKTFVAADPITVIARAAEVWITTMQPGVTGNWSGSGNAQAQWSSTGDGPALCPSP
jgi:hypothetical protein